MIAVGGGEERTRLCISKLSSGAARMPYAAQILFERSIVEKKVAHAERIGQ